LLQEVTLSGVTVFLARLLGLFTILVVAAMMFRGSALVEPALANQPVMLIYGITSLGLGLAMVLGHNVWSGGALPVVVTLVGWLILAKGIVLLILAPDAVAQFYTRMHYAERFNFYLIPSLVVGIYLTWAGFAARARSQLG
jgi:hypothetical protein